MLFYKNGITGKGLVSENEKNWRISKNVVQGCSPYSCRKICWSSNLGCGNRGVLLGVIPLQPLLADLCVADRFCSVFNVRVLRDSGLQGAYQKGQELAERLRELSYRKYGNHQAPGFLRKTRLPFFPGRSPYMANMRNPRMFMEHVVHVGCFSFCCMLDSPNQCFKIVSYVVKKISECSSHTGRSGEGL